MQYSVYTEALPSDKHELIVLPVATNKTSTNVKKLFDSLPKSIQSRINSVESGSFKQSELLFNPKQSDSASSNQWLMIINVNVNTGSKTATTSLDNTQYQQILQSIAKNIQHTKAKSTLILAEDIDLHSLSTDTKEHNHHKYQQAVTSIDQYFYHFDECKGKQGKSKLDFPLKSTKIQFHSTTKANQTIIRDAIKIGVSLSEGIALCKNLGNLPGNICTPSYLAKTAKSLAKDSPIKTTVLDEKQMEKLGMRTLLSVSKGSDEPAKFIIMEYHGGNKDDAPTAIVGKGLTFDAGGISIKPAAAMDEMKYDMCGGASVFGVMKALSLLKPKINVIGIVPSSENLINGKANKPGDIIKSMDGKTIEILNTDAEGRLILADALTYTKRFKPKTIIDIATLTGACIIALGHHMSGLFSNNNELSQSLSETGKKTGDLAWQLPLHPLYTKQLQSNFADLGNIGGRSAGAITAASFLQEFVDSETPWAHLDIAGTAWVSGSAKGATGRPVSLLLNYILKHG